ncbi:MAG: FxsA family protein [Porticoccaceae bacterium]|nr:FxsA family protein [Porticoccaceae bacterium]
MRFFLFFLAVPVFELWLLIQVGGVIGAWPTIALVLLTAMIGVALLKKEGFKLLTRSNLKLDAGELPAQEVFEGFVLGISGALLLAPGFATDVVGFLGLIPWTRRWLVTRLLAKAEFRAFVVGQCGDFRQRSQNGRDVFDGEYWRHDDSRRKPLDPPG